MCEMKELFVGDDDDVDEDERKSSPLSWFASRHLIPELDSMVGL